MPSWEGKRNVGIFLFSPKRSALCHLLSSIIHTHIYVDGQAHRATRLPRRTASSRARSAQHTARSRSRNTAKLSEKESWIAAVQLAHGGRITATHCDLGQSGFASQAEAVSRSKAIMWPLSPYLCTHEVVGRGGYVADEGCVSAALRCALTSDSVVLVAAECSKRCRRETRVA